MPEDALTFFLSSFPNFTIRRPSCCKRRFFAISALTVLSLAAASSQAWSWGNTERIKGSGDVSSEVRDVGGFDSIALSGGFKVLVRQGAQSRVEVKTDRNLQSYIETRIVDGKKGRTLEISPKRGYEVQGTVRPEIVLDLAQLRNISVAGSGDVARRGHEDGRGECQRCRFWRCALC